MSGLSYKPNVAAVILAAGESVRMTGIKQLLPWKNTTLLGHVLGQLKETSASGIYLVLGAHKEAILEKTDVSGMTLVQNEDWQQGMGTSISKCMNMIQKEDGGYDGILIAVCDQPMLSVNHYKKLINSCIDHDRIIASYYDSGFGVPAVFGRCYFDELSGLKKDAGAKSIIKEHLRNLIRLDAPLGAIDIDTEELYEKYHPTHGH